MRVQTISYRPNAGWSAPVDPTLDSATTLVLASASPAFADQLGPFRDLARALPRAQMLGCSIASDSEDRISVAIARFEHTTLRAATARLARPADSLATGARIARALDAPDLRGVFLLSSGDSLGTGDLVRGVNDGLASRARVTSSLGGQLIEHTWVLAGSAVAAGLVAAVGMYGAHLRFAHGPRGGWDVLTTLREAP
jgi:hypothetical protein